MRVRKRFTFYDDVRRTEMSNIQKLKKRTLKKYKHWSLLSKIDFSVYVFAEQVGNDDCGAFIRPDNNIGYWVRM